MVVENVREGGGRSCRGRQNKLKWASERAAVSDWSFLGEAQTGQVSRLNQRS